MSSSNERAVQAGDLKLQISQYGETCMIQLDGELDPANAGILEQEPEAALGNGGVVVDLGELSSKAQAVTRVLELTGVEERLPFAA